MVFAHRTGIFSKIMLTRYHSKEHSKRNFILARFVKFLFPKFFLSPLLRSKVEVFVNSNMKLDFAESEWFDHHFPQNGMWSVFTSLLY